MRKSGLPTKGMVLKSSEFHKVNMITRTWIGKKTSLKVGMRLIRTKLSSYNPATLGEALVARLYASLKETGGRFGYLLHFTILYMKITVLLALLPNKMEEK